MTNEQEVTLAIEGEELVVRHEGQEERWVVEVEEPVEVRK